MPVSSEHDPDAEMTAENVPECMGHTVLDDGEEGITETDVQEAAVDAISDDKASPETAPSHTFKEAIHPSPQSLLCQTSPAETSTTRVKRWLLDYSGQPQKSNQNPHTHKINQKSSLLQKPQNQ